MGQVPDWSSLPIGTGFRLILDIEGFEARRKRERESSRRFAASCGKVAVDAATARPPSVSLSAQASLEFPLPRLQAKGKVAKPVAGVIGRTGYSRPSHSRHSLEVRARLRILAQNRPIRFFRDGLDSHSFRAEVESMMRVIRIVLTTHRDNYRHTTGEAGHWNHPQSKRGQSRCSGGEKEQTSHKVKEKIE